MTATSVRLSNPLEPAKAHTLVRLAALAERLKVPMLMVGAYARDINFWHLHGIETGRRTCDVDMTVQLPDWDAFAAFSKALVTIGFSKAAEGTLKNIRISRPGKRWISFLSAEYPRTERRLSGRGSDIPGASLDWLTLMNTPSSCL